MTDMTDKLKALLAHVEAGTLHEQKHGGMPLCTACYMRDDQGYIIDSWHDANCLGAYNGSLDAAKALHDMLVPAFTRAVDATMPEAGISVDLHRNGAGEFSGDDLCEARAWLIAIIKALIAQEEGK